MSETESEDHPPQRHRLTEENVSAALKKFRGIYSFAAEHLGVARSSLHEYVKRRPELIAYREELRNTQVDRTEVQLFQQIDRGNVRAIIFYLSTQARDRGYGDVRQIVGHDGGALKVEHQAAPSALDSLDPRQLTGHELSRLRELFIRNRDNPVEITHDDKDELDRLLNKGTRKMITIDGTATEVKDEPK